MHYYKYEQERIQEREIGWRTAKVIWVTQAMGESLCFICSRPGVRTCEQCGVLLCEAHDKYHRHPETGACFPFTVDRQEGVGRLVRAARDLEPGDEIWREEEVVVGPARRIPPVCLGCGQKVTGEVRCGGCGWPVCSDTCPEMWRHAPEECGVIRVSGDSVRDNRELDDEECPLYRAIMVLRVLQLGAEDRDYMLEFMDHTEDREEGDADPVVETIRDIWGQDQWSEELVRRVEGILDVNTVEHRVQVGEGPSGRAFLPITSLASHSCRSNSFKDKVSVPGWVVTRAKVGIRAGEEITFHYCGGLKGRLLRRSTLLKGWFFLCGCDRCGHPGERGAELSSLGCRECGGVVRPVRPLEQGTEYRCGDCGAELTSGEVEELEEGLRAELETCYISDTVALEQLLDKHKALFHPRHWLILIIKWLLVTSWGRVAGIKHHQLEEAVIERKLVYAQDYLTALNIVDPGISHNRGMTLWEIHSATSFLANKRFKEERLAPLKFLEMLSTCLEAVREAKFSLQFNKEGSNEAQMRRAACEAEGMLLNGINTFQSMLGIKLK